jgi:hypothetical protein
VSIAEGHGWFPFLKDKPTLHFRKWNVKYALENQQNQSRRTTNSRPIPPIPLPFGEVMKDVLKVKRPEKVQRKPHSHTEVSKK